MTASGHRTRAACRLLALSSNVPSKSTWSTQLFHSIRTIILTECVRLVTERAALNSYALRMIR